MLGPLTGAPPARRLGWVRTQVGAAAENFMQFHLSIALMILAPAPVEAVAPAAPGAPPSDAAAASYAAHVAAAEKSLRLGEALEVRRWLDGAEESARGWEWYHLDRASDSSIQTLTCEESPSRIVLSPDGSTAAVVIGSDVHLLRARDLSPIRVIKGHENSIYRAEFSRDGRMLATVARDVTSRCWDVESGAEISRMSLTNPAFAAVAFAPDGERIATGAWRRVDGAVQGMVWIWESRTGRVVHEVQVGVKPISSLHFTPDGRRIVVGTWDGIVHVLNAEGDEERRITIEREGRYTAINDLALSPDGSLVAAGTKERLVHLFRVADGSEAAVLEGHGDYVEDVEFSPDGTTICSASGDATLRLWRAGAEGSGWSGQSKATKVVRSQGRASTAK